MTAQTESPILIVGLGNPGTKYSGTRHNVGFEVIDLLAKRWQVTGFKAKFQGQLGETSRKDFRVVLLKPQTFMNLSGEAVRDTLAFYKIPPATNLVVITDDVDLPEGSLRIRKKGGSGGHNGLKSIIECCGTEDFPRLRIGVGRPSGPGTADHVLGKFTKTEKALIDSVLARAAEAVDTVLESGIDIAMNRFNQNPSTPGSSNES